ncbi:hypothetical protein [Planococcus salinus]|uniref:hypothetical protein n=1 Tax=Planococcus salinus TaxID=1848460 RepID=UPI001314937D|nr:hypothetical protein [Planococcus salinus]
MSDAYFTFLPILSILFSLIPIAIAVFVIVMWVKLSKERNAYLKEIAEELRRR